MMLIEKGGECIKEGKENDDGGGKRIRRGGKKGKIEGHGERGEED